MATYMVSSNLVGYLPEEDEPAEFDNWNEAWSFFQTFARGWADDSDELYENGLDCGHTEEEEHTEDCYGSDRAFVDAALADANISEKTAPTGYAITLQSNDGHAYSLWFALVAI
jgi:hypothetical protein